MDLISNCMWTYEFVWVKIFFFFFFFSLSCFPEWRFRLSLSIFLARYKMKVLYLVILLFHTLYTLLFFFHPFHPNQPHFHLVLFEVYLIIIYLHCPVLFLARVIRFLSLPFSFFFFFCVF
uniref:Uncharacterized protein n=1 Tax=Cacopsylla melanoneura TaxID=428564 RepID=A0A8D8S5N4_9HEMI